MKLLSSLSYDGIFPDTKTGLLKFYNLNRSVLNIDNIYMIIESGCILLKIQTYRDGVVLQVNDNVMTIEYGNDHVLLNVDVGILPIYLDYRRPDKMEWLNFLITMNGDWIDNLIKFLNKV